LWANKGFDRDEVEKESADFEALSCALWPFAAKSPAAVRSGSDRQ